VPTILTHPAVALGTLPCIWKLKHPGRILVMAIMLSILPDIDVIGFKFGIAYGDMLGHRGLTHSLSFAFVVSFLTSFVFIREIDKAFFLLWGYFFIALISHGLLDGVTNGGLGVAYLAPFSNERFFLGEPFIKVSPLSLERFLSHRGWAVIKSELLYVWLPVLAVYIGVFLICRQKRRRSDKSV
jgi:inner membrane protein